MKTRTDIIVQWIYGFILPILVTIGAVFSNVQLVYILRTLSTMYLVSAFAVLALEKVSKK